MPYHIYERTGKGVIEVKRVFYAAMVCIGAFLLVSAGLNEAEALGIIPDYDRI